MSRDIVNRICEGFAGAEVSDPWGGGHDAWKVGGKMFACIGSEGHGVAIKTPDVETAALLIEAGDAERAPYFHRSWALLPFEGMSDDAALRFRLARSYVLVRRGLTKTAQAGLGPEPDLGDAI